MIVDGDDGKYNQMVVLSRSNWPLTADDDDPTKREMMEVGWLALSSPK